MVDGVRNERGGIVEQQQPLRLIEPCSVDCPVFEPALTGAEAPKHGGRILRELDDRVMARVGHKVRPARQRDHLPGEAQLSRLSLRRHVRRVPPAKRALGVELRHERRQQRTQTVRVTLAGHLRDDVPRGVDHRQRRPGPHREGLPRGQLRIVEHRMMHAIPLTRRDQRLVVGLVRELRRVHPHGDQHVRELRLELAQLVQHVQAVGAAERPEVQQDDLPAQIGPIAAGVDPTAPSDQLGGAYACMWGHGHI